MHFNPLPDMPILVSSTSAANKRYDVKDMDKLGFIYMIELKTWWEKEKLLFMSNFSFPHLVFKSCLLLMHQNKYLWTRRLRMFLNNYWFIWTLKTGKPSPNNKM